jgi:3-carboxy-cis,cis-muconate cycloisomerase
MGALFDPLLGMDAVATATGDRAWLTALCETETALARACARAGVIDLPTALEIGAACEQAAAGDPAELGRRAVAGGNPVIPLVDELRERVAKRAGDDAAGAVHLGATSQDVLDTASMLITRRALELLLPDLAACADACADLARAHRDTPMAGRTLLQLAAPITFGALAAGWGSALDRSHARLGELRAALPVQLGGAVGTLSVLYPKGLEVLAAFADELGLAEPVAPWHTDRTTITELAGALGASASAVAKASGDVVLLAQDEVGELQEAHPGGSSAMAHKQNPIAAITARAAAAQAPGLVATLLAAAAPELQRGAGPWHAEWPALTGLLRATGGAAARLRSALTGLRVNADAMATNLAALGGDAETGHAGEFVDRYLDGRRSPGRHE